VARVRIAVALLAALLTVGCAGDAGVRSRPFSLGYLAKSDVDIVSDLHLRASFDLLRRLAVKLYRRNPAEWRRSGAGSLKARVDALFPDPPHWNHPELGGRRGSEALLLAFEPGYRGDRVLAFVAGLSAMTYMAYGSRTESYLLDQLDPQKLYNLARNLEIAAWKLRTGVDGEGRPWLLSTALDPEAPNLSFERLFGQLISLQDMMARIVAEKTNRTIRTVVQQMATAVFLPI